MSEATTKWLLSKLIFILDGAGGLVKRDRSQHMWFVAPVFNIQVSFTILEIKMKCKPDSSGYCTKAPAKN